MVQGQWFDGRSPKGRAVQVHVADGQMHLSGPEEGQSHSLELAQIRWPEAQRHGLPTLHLAQGGSVQLPSAAALQTLKQQARLADSWVQRSQQSWKGAVAALALLVAVCAGLYVWGIPVGAKAVVAMLPADKEAALGVKLVEQLDKDLFKASRLPQAKQEAIRGRFETMARSLAQSSPPGELGPVKLHFRSGKALGPNAVALPGGQVLITDELVELAANNEDMVLGVLAHELGHVKHRHSLRMLAQAGAIAVVASVLVGDFSTVLATAPALVGQMAYSRHFEREADEQAYTLMRQERIDPAVMSEFFTRIEAWQKQERKDEGPGPWSLLSSHPVHAERQAFYKTGQWPP